MESPKCKEVCRIREMALPPGEKLILRALADLGSSPGVPALAAATGYSQRHVRRLLGSLVARGVLHEQDAPAGKAKHYVTPDKMSPLTSEADPGQNVTPDMPLRARVTRARAVVVVKSLESPESKDSLKTERTTTTGDVTPDTMSGDEAQVVQLALSLPLMSEQDARRLVKLHGAARVKAVVGYAATYADWLTNPAGFAVAMLGRGWSPPQEPDSLAQLLDGKRYTTGKFADFIQH